MHTFHLDSNHKMLFCICLLLLLFELYNIRWHEDLCQPMKCMSASSARQMVSLGDGGEVHEHRLLNAPAVIVACVV